MSDALPRIGFGLPVSGAWATPQTMVDIATHAEDLGYASLWTFQRLLVPLSGTLDHDYESTHNPGVTPLDAPPYRAVHDPLVPLAYVAAHTRRIGLGTATICAPYTPPALLAKTLATLDHVTAGRLTVGLGIGWLPQEYAAAGIPMEQRGARMDEYLRCLKACWTDDPVDFAGAFYSVPASHIGVTPLQKPHPPLVLGGAAPAALRRAGRLADGWISGTRQDLDHIESSIRLVREGAQEAGRDPEAVQIIVRGVPRLLDSPVTEDREPFNGTRGQIMADLRALHARGVTEVFFDLNFSPRFADPLADADSVRAEALQLLENLAPLV